MQKKLDFDQFKSFLMESSIIWGRQHLHPGGYQKFMNSIFGMLSMKYLSDLFEEAQEKVLNHYLSKGESRIDAERLSSDKDEYEMIFFIPEGSRWANLKLLKKDIGEELIKSAKAIEAYNPKLEGLLAGSFDEMRYTLSDSAILRLILYFSEHRLLKQDFDTPDLLGKGCEFLIEQFEYMDRHGEFTTPKELSRLLVSLLSPSSGMKVYDPTSGSGGMLIETRNYLIERGENAENLSLYGQEINQNNWEISNKAMLLHGVFDADIRNGDTLCNPQHEISGKLMSFDRVIGNPPLSMKRLAESEESIDHYNRYSYGIPPKQNSDFAFIQHMITSLKSDGKMGVIVSKGTLFRGGIENDIRKGIIMDDLIEAIIELPSSLFYNNNIQTLIVIINKKKSRERKNKILFISATKEYEIVKFKNKLREPDIKKIISTYEGWKVEENFSDYLTLEQLKSDDFNIYRSIQKIKFDQTVNSIDTNFKKYKSYKLSDISEVQRLKEVTNQSKKIQTKEKNNDIFIPLIGISDVVENRKETKLKDQNLFKVSLNPEIVKSDYLTIFFNSELGIETRKFMFSPSIIPTLNTSSISNIVVYIPSFKEQEKIVKASKSLLLMKKKVNDIEKKLKLKPDDVKQQELIDSVISLINDLNLRVSPLLCEESITHEFKASLRAPYPNYPEPSVNDNGQQQFIMDKEVFKSKVEIHTYFENIILKTIASFLNTRGGKLVIGVHEFANKKQVVGIEREGFESNDHYERHLIQKLNNTFGAVVVSNFLSVEISKLQGLSVCVVTCKEDTGSEIFYLEDIVYVRTGPRIDRLSTKEVVELSKTRSKSN